MLNLALRSFVLPTVAFIGLLATVIPAGAAPMLLDCKTGCALQSIAGDPGGALWSTGSIQPSGTGVFKPFVRLQANGNDTTEDGHNTDANGANDEKGGIWTHSVKMSDLDNIAVIAGISYYEFMLDLGEPADLDKSLLSLDAFKICTAGSGNLAQLNDCPAGPSHYDMDAGADRGVQLDYNLVGGGNGNSDLFVYIPKSALAGAAPYFYLYTSFGLEGGAYQAEGTFEEWAFQTRIAAPEPELLFLFGAGLLTAGYRMRRRV